MSENLPAPASTGWLAEWIANVKIPGAAKAIARFVGSTADMGSAWVGIGTAKAEQIQQGIKDETAAKSAFTKAVSKAAAQKGAADEALIDRAAQHWAGKHLREQQNRESIALRTIDHLEDDPPIDARSDGPTDDWMNIYDGFASQANSEKLQDTWARILAGEVRRPGSFSFRTLQFISVLDQNLADVVQRTASLVCNDRVIYLDDEDIVGDLMEDLCTLQDVGFLRFQGLVTGMTANDQGHVFANFGKKAVIGKTNPGHNFMIPSVILSPVGIEMMRILSREVNFDQMKRAADKFRKNGCDEIGVLDVNRDGTASLATFFKI